MTTPYNRHQRDVGNIVAFEHINVCVPDLALAKLFYVDALGLDQDIGPELLWVNAGRQQFHLIAGDPQVVRGIINVTVPSLELLQTRLERLADRFVPTEFCFERETDVLNVVCPWGNRLRCTAADPAGIQVGLSGIGFDVPPGSSGGIGRFYREAFGAAATVESGRCHVEVGAGQSLHFTETDGSLADFDGHHIAVYVANFSGPHGWLNERTLITEESSENQYRFNWIVDPESGERLFEIEHEVRSLHHPLYQRPLKNRDLSEILTMVG